MLLVLLAVSPVVGCGGSGTATGDTTLINHWTHSHEEDSGDSTVYRPSTHGFPPSRGRSGWEFRSDGSVIRHAIAPTDGIARDTGTWSLAGNQTLTITLATGSPATSRYPILQLVPGRLVLGAGR